MSYGQIKRVFVMHANLCESLGMSDLIMNPETVLSTSKVLCNKVSHSCPVRANYHLVFHFCGEICDFYMLNTHRM